MHPKSQLILFAPIATFPPVHALTGPALKDCNALLVDLSASNSLPLETVLPKAACVISSNQKEISSCHSPLMALSDFLLLTNGFPALYCNQHKGPAIVSSPAGTVLVHHALDTWAFLSPQHKGAFCPALTCQFLCPGHSSAGHWHSLFSEFSSTSQVSAQQ